MGIIDRLAAFFWNEASHRRTENITALITGNPGSPIVVFPTHVDWHLPIFQRPAQLALAMSQAGALCLYLTSNHKYDAVRDIERVGDRCFLLNHRRYGRAFDALPGVWMYACSPTLVYNKRWFRERLAAGQQMIYDYIDEIHEDIVSRRIPGAVHERHQFALQDERVLVVASADKLLADVARLRSRNFLLATNGVDLEHFRSVSRADGPPPEALRGFVGGVHHVVGYYGALAKWFDYDLVAKLARARPDWNILLIGYDYDGSLRRAQLDRLTNVRVVPAVPYAELPRYAVWFDVAMIPFKVNDITLATSPIKLFEYMAMGLPMVTTALPECRKYSSVHVAEDHDHFIRLVEAAWARREEPEYQRLLSSEAEANSWQLKAQHILREMQAMSAPPAC